MSTHKIMELDYENILSFAGKDVISSWQGRVSEACSALRNGTGPGSDYLGWLGLPGEIGEEVFSDIEAGADKIKSQSDVFIVVGIGGSYLGARAVIEAVKPNFFNEKSGTKTKVYFAGQNISPGYMKDLMELVRDRDVSINVISKSGTTTEPGIAFRLLREMVEARYGEGAKERIFATTDKHRGALRKLADNRGYRTYVIPDNVGGRFSVLTPVGLLPIAAAGVNIRELVKGASDMAEACRSDKIFESPACTYAAIRNQMLKSGKQIEVLSTWSPKLHYIAEWWKQLFGESEGKEGKGIYPAACDLTTDLHSIGQYLQEGQRVIFETFILPGDDIKEICVRKDPENLDELNYLEGRSFDFINKKAAEGTAKAHRDGGAPNMTVRMPELNEYYLGQLLYFFELSCAISGYILGVNPFNQPGVEVYKKNMFSLLGKPGC